MQKSTSAIDQQVPVFYKKLGKINMGQIGNIHCIYQDKCVVSHFWFIHFWLKYRNDATFLPWTRARGGEGYDEAVLAGRQSRNPSVLKLINYTFIVNYTFSLIIKSICIAAGSQVFMRFSCFTFKTPILHVFLTYCSRLTYYKWITWKNQAPSEMKKWRSRYGRDYRKL